jgi:hypothetical protein
MNHCGPGRQCPGADFHDGPTRRMVVVVDVIALGQGPRVTGSEVDVRRESTAAGDEAPIIRLRWEQGLAPW